MGPLWDWGATPNMSALDRRHERIRGLPLVSNSGLTRAADWRRTLAAITSPRDGRIARILEALKAKNPPDGGLLGRLGGEPISAKPTTD